jgi:hypothetical protein
MHLMPRIFRSRGFASLTLAAFLVAQPVVGCAALCLLERHHAGQHGMPGMDGGKAALGNGACHTGITGADQHMPVQVLPPMEPAREPVIAVLPTESVEPLDALPTLSPLVSHTVEPPPPRSV